MLLFFKNMLQKQNGMTKQSNLFFEINSKKKYEMDLFEINKQ